MKQYTFITILFISIASIILNNCTNNKSEVKNTLLAGQESLISYCTACHNLPNSPRTGIAPPFSNIKKAYLSETEQNFSNSMISFLNNPTKESAKMKNAVDKHGLMPKMSYSEGELKKITHYLFHTDFNDFKEISEGEIEKVDSIDYLETGRSLALKTKSILGKNLMYNVKEKGAAGAIEFCNEKAIFLTDSMSQSLNAKIKRVSDKPRNSNNMANSKELEYIDELKKGKDKTGITFEKENKIIGYYPIETNDMCMKCHGTIENDINSKTLLKINDLYHDDKAVGYKPNQIRGIWVVEMEKSN